MVLLCKQKALYVKGCVIANGITDSQGDTLFAEDIKKIFTSFNNQDSFELYHDEIPIEEVSLLENYISTADETIGNLIVPSGSWNCVIRVDNPDIQEGLLTGEIGGLSLKNRIAPKCQAGLHGTIRYQDITDVECVVPLFISFVEGGANGYPLFVMDYPAYIQKSNSIKFKKGAKDMAFNLLDGLKSLIQQAEASENEDEAVVEKEDKPVEEVEEPAIEKADESTEEEKEEEAVMEKADETTEEETPVEEEEKEEEPAVVEKADETETESEAETEVDLEARVAALEEKIAELLKEETEVVEEESVEEETVEEPVDEDTPKIVKSEKVIIEGTQNIQTTNYYAMTGRDPQTGKKIR